MLLLRYLYDDLLFIIWQYRYFVHNNFKCFLKMCSILPLLRHAYTITFYISNKL